ncbi:MAG: MFS transporter, partial [Actinomycetota bacterium]|nr:MFS transporter [Actinomycetota bacterium]
MTEAVRVPALRLAVLAVALVGGLDAVEEYFPVLAGDRGVPTVAVPAAVLGITLAGALGAALGGRAGRLP